MTGLRRRAHILAGARTSLTGMLALAVPLACGTGNGNRTVEVSADCNGGVTTVEVGDVVTMTSTTEGEELVHCEHRWVATPPESIDDLEEQDCESRDYESSQTVTFTITAPGEVEVRGEPRTSWPAVGDNLCVFLANADDLPSQDPAPDDARE